MSDWAKGWQLTFMVPGKPCSNNLVTRRVGNRSVKSAEAREYQARVASIAYAAKAAFGLAPHDRVEACKVRIEAFNVRLDAGNIEKCIGDGMTQAGVYQDDNRIVRLDVEKFRDDGEQRIVVTVEPCDPLVKPKKAKRLA